MSAPNDLRRGHQVEKYFVDAQGSLDTLKATIESRELPTEVLHICGHGGLGKTSLLLMFEAFCRDRRLPVAFVTGEEVRDTVGLLDKFAESLKRSDVQLSTFTSKLRRYRLLQAGFEATATAQRTASVAAVKQAAEAAGDVAGALAPVVAPAMKALREVTAGILEAFLAKKSKADGEFYLNAQTHLEECFRTDLVAAAKGRRLVLLLDSYEQLQSMDESVDDWVCKFADTLPANVLLVLAGRDRLRSRRPTGARTRGLKLIELTEMRTEHIRDLLERYYRSERSQPEPGRVDQITELARGSPLKAILFAQTWHPGLDIDTVRRMTVEEVYQAWRRGTQQDLVEALDAIAVTRWFTLDLLRELVEPAKANYAFEKLKSLHAVRPGKEDWSLHGTIAEDLREYWWQNDKEKVLALHRKALAAYQKTLLRMEKEGAAAEERQKIVLEILFQSLQDSPHNWITCFIQVFDDWFARKRQFAFCRQLLDDAKKYASQPAYQAWSKFCDARLDMLGELRSAPSKSRQVLEELLKRPDLDMDLKVQLLEVLATSGWYDNLVDPNGTDKARQIYRELADDHEARGNPLGCARALVWLGVLDQRIEGDGTGHFKRALEILEQLDSATAGRRELIATAKRENAVALRMKGRLAEAGKFIEDSVQGFAASGLEFEKAHSLLNRGFLLTWLGQLRQAESSLRESMRLFESGGQWSAIERAWPLIGLADVARCRGQHSGALGWCGQAKSVWSGDLFGEAVCLAKEAEIRLDKGEFPDVLALLKRSDPGRRASQDKFGQGWALRTRGYALMGLGQPDDARECFEQGRRIMEEYETGFGESELALGLCRVHLATEQFVEFDKVATEAETLAGRKDRYLQHLAPLKILRGFAAVRTGSGKPAAQSGTDGLQLAVRYNIFLLDQVLREMKSMFPGEVIEKVAARWRKARIDGEEAVAYEKRKRKDEDVDGSHKEPVLAQLESRRARSSGGPSILV